MHVYKEFHNNILIGLLRCSNSVLLPIMCCAECFFCCFLWEQLLYCIESLQRLTHPMTADMCKEDLHPLFTFRDVVSVEGVHRFSSNIGATPKSQVPGGCHEESSVLSAQKYWVPQYQIQAARQPGAQDLCVSDLCRASSQRM